MNVMHWLKCWFSSRSKAQSLYRRGMAKAGKHKLQGAIKDYTAVINMPDVHCEVKSMALYHRALIHLELGDDWKAAGDFDAVLAMEEALINVKTMARQKLAGMKPRSPQGNRIVTEKPSSPFLLQAP